jgi:shikimate dehydrogenase
MIGRPLHHARSPGLLNPMFRARGDDVTVVTHELGPEDLPPYVSAMRRDPEAIGLIVTTPLKQVITEYLSERTGLVDFLGASNCVRFDRGGWIGANFDGHGFLAALAEVGGGAIAGKRILLVGCGGAGSAIAASLTQAAPLSLNLHDIDRKRAAEFAERLARFAPASTVEAVDRPSGRYDIIINASTAGMNPGDRSPIEHETVAAAGIVADIVTVEDTALKRSARALGKPVLTGGAMVTGQVGLLRRFLIGAARSERDVLIEEGATRRS